MEGVGNNVEEVEDEWEDAEEESKDERGVLTLGFVEDVEEERLLRREHFPSKVGGRVAWMDPKRIPDADRMKCPVCGVCMRFLLQLYCPLENVQSSFHRSLCIFVCREADCSGCKVIRSQLLRENEFYPSVYDENAEPGEEALGRQCVLCSLKASKVCGQCSVASYCSRTCQQADWRLGHKSCCGTLESDELRQRRTQWLFSQHELVLEAEEDLVNVETESIKVVTKGTMQDASTEELGEDTFNKVDPDLVHFQTQVARAPRQSVRYQLRGDILWPFQENKLTIPPPDCHLCGSRRVFEFQVLPQLLYFLHIEDRDVDFATLAVYTCEKSCPVEGYVDEYIYRQPPQ